ncbi:unnamed protein product [Diplocarpon coronariae]|uniref:Transcription elongation factor Eaf N-terminal domain-containing protein n=1 Tax=Diplocarpon coronariae TaxID=2795749 RepID=A0A218Z0N8_9HELO|nr:hypothetical protein B2J93_7306 [Marssonina coronariae]
MATLMSGSMKKNNKYPIVLSDALMGKASTEIYTGIKYNHKPDASSQNTVHLQPSDNGSASYDLSFSNNDNSEDQLYQGLRTSSGGRYVLILDPVKRHYILHCIDSTFDMKMVKESRARSLSQSDDGLTIEYPNAPANYQYKTTPLFDRQDSDEDEDAEGEEYDEEEQEQEQNQAVDHLKLPSPANHHAGELSDKDLELDLEAELEQALNGDNSSESEEE